MLKLIAIGNLGQDAIIKDVNGKKVIEFSIAHTEKFTSKGTQQERTTWVNCAYWIEKTTIAQYLKKGTQVYVVGTPTTNAYTNKNNQLVADLRLRVNSVQLLGNKNSSGASPSSPNDAPSPSNDVSADYNNNTSDDLPF